MPRKPAVFEGTSKRPFLADNDEWPDQSVPPLERDRGEEDEFFQTQDYKYVALAIGKSPTKPPQWAIDACVALKERVDISTKLIIKKKPGPKVTEADDKRLELIADIMLNKWAGPKLGIANSLRSAIRWVLDETSADDSSDYRRLARLWNSQRDYRLKRAAQRTYQRFKAQGILKG